MLAKFVQPHPSRRRTARTGYSVQLSRVIRPSHVAALATNCTWCVCCWLRETKFSLTSGNGPELTHTRRQTQLRRSLPIKTTMQDLKEQTVARSRMKSSVFCSTLHHTPLPLIEPAEGNIIVHSHNLACRSRKILVLVTLIVNEPWFISTTPSPVRIRNRLDSHCRLDVVSHAWRRPA